MLRTLVDVRRILFEDIVLRQKSRIIFLGVGIRLKGGGSVLPVESK